MRERIVTFGPDRGLLGILTPAPDAAPGAPAVLLINSGVIHHVGPNRLHVDVARRLAAAGFPVLRFDLSGIGDSAPRRDGVPLEEAVLADIGAAVDEALRLTGAARVVCMGLCLGADTGFRYACDDPRVQGLVLLDPYTFRTWRFHARKVVARLTSRGAWARIASRPARLLATAAGADRAAADADANLPEHYRFQRAGQDEMTRRYAALVERDVRLLTVFTGGTHDWYNYRDQFRDAFGAVRFGDRLALHHWPDVDHTLSTRDARARLIETTAAWLGALAAPASRRDVA